MTVYDYANNAYNVTLPNIPIYSIKVSLISGDEVVEIEFKDGTKLKVDANDYSRDNRIMDSCDISYKVRGEDIEKWLHFNPNGGYTAAFYNSAYERMKMFSR